MKKALLLIAPEKVPEGHRFSPPEKAIKPFRGVEVIGLRDFDLLRKLMAPECLEVFNVLSANPASTPHQLADWLERKPGDIDQELNLLIEAGLVEGKNFTNGRTSKLKVKYSELLLAAW